MNPNSISALKKFLMLLGEGGKTAGKYGMDMGLEGLKAGGQVAKKFPAGAAGLAGLGAGYAAGGADDDEDEDELEALLRSRGGY